MATQLEPTTVKVYPPLLAAILDAGLAPEGRVYELLKARDDEGRGCLDIAEIRDLLTAKDSPWRICGRRRLRGILAKGDGIFWQRYTKDRLWLNGPARVAQALDCGRLYGLPAALPVAALQAGLAETKAAFLASWHTGREDAEGNSMPISQAMIRKMTGISEVTQRRHNKLAGVKTQPNIAISDMPWRDNMADATYERGRGVFRLVDRRGKRGKRGRGLVAWHMPASYTSPYSQSPKGRLRKINRQIDLVISTTRGNSREVNRLYYLKGKAAVKAHSKQPDDDHYILRKPSLIPDAVQLWDAL
jgi:hypothetical protein